MPALPLYGSPPPTADCRSAVTLVCRRFHQIFYSHAPLWHSFKVFPLFDDLKARIAGRGALLRRVAGAVERLHIVHADSVESTGAGGSGTLAALLRCLEPAVAQEVQLGPRGYLRMSADGMCALQRLTRLSSLQLSARELPDNAAAVLRMLPLRRLHLDAEEFEEEVMESVLALTSLSSLHLGSEDPLPYLDWQRLTALAQLRSLTLYQAYAPDDHWLLPPTPTAFHALESFDFFAEEWYLEVTPSRCCGAAALPLALLHPAMLLCGHRCWVSEGGQSARHAPSASLRCLPFNTTPPPARLPARLAACRSAARRCGA